MRKTFMLILLATAMSCGPRDPILTRLEERLKSVVDLGRPDPTRDDVQQALTQQLRVTPVPVTGGAKGANPVFPTRETLTKFYSSNGHRLAWCDPSGEILPTAKSLLETLRRSGEHGLAPEDYALGRLDFLAARIGKPAPDEDLAARLADFDLLMTAAFLRYASDLSSGRVHPDEVRDDWHTNPPELDLLSGLEQALKGGSLPKLLEALPPPHTGYERLRKALKDLRDIEAAGGWPKIPEGPELKPGSRGPRVALLRQRLSGDAGQTDADAGELYDGALADSVRHFQEHHGLQPDGKLGAATLAELNRPVGWRIRQVELNLERYRWIPRQLGDPHVLVNIPGFHLELARGGASVWSTRIVVGKALKPTPVFSDNIVAIVANPPWNVPESIALGEYLPELRDDPKAFERHGLRILEGTGEDAQEVKPSKVDWDEIGDGKFPYHLRQDPGPENALGRVKFHLTNEYNIYLHDTPARSLFGQADRDLSHGCIRVEKPLELAGLLLGDSARDELREALETTEERHIPVKPQVPIHILYLTAWADQSGQLRFGQDVYELDGPQRTALDRVTTSR